MNKILLVEDDVAVSDMMKDYLVNNGFEVKIAYDGQEAIDKFNFEKFDLLLRESVANVKKIIFINKFDIIIL